MNMVKRGIATCAIVFALSGCTGADEDSVAGAPEADLARSDVPASVPLADEASVEKERDGATGVDELLKQPDSLPVLDSNGGSTPDSYDGLDIDEDELGVETANFIFEARDGATGITGVGETISVPVGSTVAFSLVTPQQGELFVEKLGVSAQTNGDVGQVVFSATETGLYPVVFRSNGNTRLVTTLAVDG